jgi:hypothetical protein
LESLARSPFHAEMRGQLKAAVEAKEDIELKRASDAKFS